LVDEDVAALVRHWGDAQVRRYLWDDKPVTDDMVSNIVTTSNEDFKRSGYGIWAVRFAGDDALLGMCGLRQVEGRAWVEVLYSLRPRYWRRGLATEAARAVLSYGLEELELDRIVAAYDPQNVASASVLSRLGMSPFENGEGVVDGLEYRQVTRERFRSLSAPPPSQSSSR
jgi:RimJ/RimL family protein N-acetyltransferase